ncbi:MAG: hypothetical protein U1E78_02490 [Gammaproteobacteria bacterium]
MNNIFQITEATDESLKKFKLLLANTEYISSETRKNHTASYPMHNRYFKNGDKPLVILVNTKNTMKLHYDGKEYTINQGEMVLFDDNVMHAWKMDNNDMEIHFYRAKTDHPIKDGTYCID